MPDRSAAYFHAKARAAVAGDVVSEVMAKISAADLVLRRWKSDRIPHEPRRKRSAEDPLKGLREWPSWQVASEALRRYLGCVREMDEAFAALSSMEKQEVAGAPLRGRKRQR
jgi:hypothetical protein